MTKSKNTLLNRIVAVLLIITIFPHTDISVLAAENDGDSYTVYSVNAISSEEENPFTAYFLCRDNNLFINIDSAGQLIGGPGVLEDDYYVFTTKYNKKIEISKNSCCLVSDNFYIPFIDFIIQGNIYIQTEGNVLVAEVLMTEEEAKSIISETYDTRLNDPFLMARDDKSMQIAMDFSSCFDVLYNFKIFSASQYLQDKCRSAILTLIKKNYETESDVFYLDKFHTALKKLSLLAKLEAHGWSRYDWYAYAAESVGGAYGLAFLKSYGELDELIDIDGLMSIIELSLSYGQQNINILHGLEAISEMQFSPLSDISIVTKELSAFYNSKNIGSAELIASSFFAKHLETTLFHSFKLSNGELFWTEIAVGVEKALFDGILDVQARMDTVGDINTYFQIQKAARNYWKEVRNKNLTKDHILIQRDVALTFLYSQLCAISSYENSDKSINFSRNEKSILSQIRSLSSISDLSMGKKSEIESQRKPEFSTKLVDFMEANGNMVALGDEGLMQNEYEVNVPDWYVVNGVAVCDNELCFSRDDGLQMENGEWPLMVMHYIFDEELTSLCFFKTYNIFQSETSASQYADELNTYDEEGRNIFGMMEGEAYYYNVGNILVEEYSVQYIDTLPGIHGLDELIAMYSGYGWTIEILP